MLLYPYQERVKALIRRGESVVLQAPTGAGKTLAALTPFMESFFGEHGGSFPSKCVYVVPMRVLAHQFVHNCPEYVKSYMRNGSRAMRVTIQTGDQPEDPRFEKGDLTFCTIDQFLSSCLTMPYSLPNRLANLNAGAMVGAFVVLDEFHLLDPQSSLPTALYVLKQLRQVAPVLLMTATFSAAMLNALAQELAAQVELVSPEEARDIENRTNPERPRQRMWCMADGPLSAESVLADHDQRSLVLCNTVSHAQRLYRELRSLASGQHLEIQFMLLHSRFLPDDRRRIEDELRRIFGKDSGDSGSAIAVSTQAIEVGVDITCKSLHTELAPASALIQRAGRCARFPGEQGRVTVYPVESYAPYGKEAAKAEEDPLWVKEMKAAHRWLADHKGESFDFETEQSFVNAVATHRDQRVLTEVSAGAPRRAQAIQRVLAGERMANDSRLLVRDADSRIVLVHSHPDELLQNPYGAVGFGLQLNSLFGLLSDWQKRGAHLPWQAMRLVEATAGRQEDDVPAYAWEPAQRDSLPAAHVLVVNPVLAGYLVDEGFVSDRGDTGFESWLPAQEAKGAWEGHSYRLESYEEHIQRTMEAAEQVVWPELYYPAQALEQAAGWPKGSVWHAAHLACLFHDVGKLSKGWQGWARAYQHEIGRSLQPEFAAAHTDTEWGNFKQAEAERAVRIRHPKPHHAAQGAVACSAILNAALAQNQSLVRATLAAILRHHTPFAQDCGPYALEEAAAAHIEATLKCAPEDTRQSLSLDLLRVKTDQVLAVPLPSPGDCYGWLAYVLLVRALRRADQEGTAQGSKEV